MRLSVRFLKRRADPRTCPMERRGLPSEGLMIYYKMGYYCPFWIMSKNIYYLLHTVTGSEIIPYLQEFSLIFLVIFLNVLQQPSELSLIHPLFLAVLGYAKST